MRNIKPKIGAAKADSVKKERGGLSKANIRRIRNALNSALALTKFIAKSGKKATLNIAKTGGRAGLAVGKGAKKTYKLTKKAIKDIETAVVNKSMESERGQIPYSGNNDSPPKLKAYKDVTTIRRSINSELSKHRNASTRLTTKMKEHRLRENPENLMDKMDDKLTSSNRTPLTLTQRAEFKNKLAEVKNGGTSYKYTTAEAMKTVLKIAFNENEWPEVPAHNPKQ